MDLASVGVRLEDLVHLVQVDVPAGEVGLVRHRHAAGLLLDDLDGAHRAREDQQADEHDQHPRNHASLDERGDRRAGAAGGHAERPDRIDDGPVLIQIEYRIERENVDQFMRAIAKVETIRRRNGASDWLVFRDLGEDGRFVQVTRFEDGVTYARFGPDRALYLVSNAAGTPRGEIRRLREHRRLGILRPRHGVVGPARTCQTCGHARLHLRP